MENYYFREETKMLDSKYWNSVHLKLLKIIGNSDWIEKEKKFEKEKLNRLFRNMQKEGQLNNQYISLAHEIKSYNFLKIFGNVEKAIDSNNTTGPDFTLGNYKIECVACSPGETKDLLEKYQLTEYRKSVTQDYKRMQEIILPRITSSLKYKVNKFNIYLQKRNCKKQ